jgi:hypothetical protein
MKTSRVVDVSSASLLVRLSGCAQRSGVPQLTPMGGLTETKMAAPRPQPTRCWSGTTTCCPHSRAGSAAAAARSGNARPVATGLLGRADIVGRSGMVPPLRILSLQ